MKIDLLWENDSLSEPFSPGFISLHLENYKLVIVEFCFSTTETTKNNSIVMIDDSGVGSVCFKNNTYRSYTTNKNGITFSNGILVSSYGYESSNNYACIPNKIYGVK